MPSKAASKEKVGKKIVVQKSSKDLKQKFEWKVKKVENASVTSVNIVIPITFQKTVGLRKAMSKQPLVEYNFRINEKTMAFCFYPKVSRNKPFEMPVGQKSQSKSKALAKVPKPNSEPKNSKTH